MSLLKEEKQHQGSVNNLSEATLIPSFPSEPPCEVDFRLHNACFVQAQLYLGKRVVEDVLKETKETDSLCTATKRQYEADQAHLLKNPDNPIDQSGITSRVRTAQCYFQNCHYHHQSSPHALQMSSLNPQMFPGTLKANMWHKLLAAFPLMDQDGLKKVFSICFPFAPWYTEGSSKSADTPRCPGAWHWRLGAILKPH